jgi:amidophosphoribosyltransferase
MCGLVGYVGKDAAAVTALGLHGVQNRGHEGAGVVVYDGKKKPYHRTGFGKVGELLGKGTDFEKDRPSGDMAAGHVRYSTQGEPDIDNLQPMLARKSDGTFFALAHNGNITNSHYLRGKLESQGAIFTATSDTAVVMHLFARSLQPGVVKKMEDAIGHLEGSYALIAMTDKMLIGARDPLGIRPLVLGKMKKGGAPMLASETTALRLAGARYVREVQNGEMVILTPGSTKVQIHRFAPKQAARPDLFEYIYLAKPDSIASDGQTYWTHRYNSGVQLAQEAPVKADVVVPIPSSGEPAAQGYAQALGIPYMQGIIRNHDVGRTFIEPDVGLRNMTVSLKHAANTTVLKGRRVVLVDDSVVRGTTSQKIVEMVYEAGAKEVHMRVASAPIKFPDFYGIDTPHPKDLLASHMSIAQIRDLMDVKSLKYLSVEGMYKAFGHPEGRNDKQPQFSDHAFTGDYPTTLTDLAMGATMAQSR